MTTFGNVPTNAPASVDPTTASVRTAFQATRDAGVALEGRVQTLETGGGTPGATGVTGGTGGTGGTGSSGTPGGTGGTGAVGGTGGTGGTGAPGASGTAGAGGAAVALYGGNSPDIVAPGPHPNGTLYINVAAMSTGGATLWMWDTIDWTPLF